MGPAARPGRGPPRGPPPGSAGTLLRGWQVPGGWAAPAPCAPPAPPGDRGRGGVAGQRRDAGGGGARLGPRPLRAAGWVSQAEPLAAARHHQPALRAAGDLDGGAEGAVRRALRAFGRVLGSLLVLRRLARRGARLQPARAGPEETVTVSGP